ncbi:MAG: hypothetical protein KJZ86_22135, partial [Caldilineaceae bacterium]|nr:hypothetical protein [Caldilineaceae bacterium]
GGVDPVPSLEWGGVGWGGSTGTAGGAQGTKKPARLRRAGRDSRITDNHLLLRTGIEGQRSLSGFVVKRNMRQELVASLPKSLVQYNKRAISIN